MTRIKPFKGIRPIKSLAKTLSSRPYDVLSSDEAREESKDIPHSLYRIIKPEVEFDHDIDEYDDKVYQKAIDNFNDFINKGWLIQDKDEHYYIYSQRMGDRTQYGFVVASHIEDYLNGKIKKHELTDRKSVV